MKFWIIKIKTYQTIFTKAPMLSTPSMPIPNGESVVTFILVVVVVIFYLSDMGED